MSEPAGLSGTPLNQNGRPAVINRRPTRRAGGRRTGAELGAALACAPRASQGPAASFGRVFLQIGIPVLGLLLVDCRTSFKGFPSHYLIGERVRRAGLH